MPRKQLQSIAALDEPGEASTPPLIIGIDSREKHAYTFDCMRTTCSVPFTTKKIYLPTGDYTILGPFAGGNLPGDQIIIERKSMQDLYTTLGQHRERFEAEYARMSLFGYAALVIEATWDQIMQPLKFLNHPSRLHPRSVHATLIAWSQRYDVHVCTYPGREIAEMAVFRMLERWAKDRMEKQCLRGAS